MMAEAVRPANAWLFGPATDVLLGGGLVYAALFVVLVVGGDSLRAAQPAALVALGAVVLSGPHYGATLLRVYEKRSDRRAYVIFATWATLLVAGWFVASVHVSLLGSLLFTVYLTWSPWHYSGQNFGICMMFLRRGGIEVSSPVRRLLHTSFLSSFLLTFLVFHGSTEAAGYVPNPVGYGAESIERLSLGVPREWTRLVFPWVALASFGTAAAAFWMLRRQTSSRALAPAATLVATQALWFSLPMSVSFWRIPTGIAPFDLAATPYYVFWIAMAHAVQYMWITCYFAKAKPDWEGYWPFYAKTLAAGAAVWTLPPIVFASSHLGSVASAEKLLLLVAAAVNIHHFVLDGAIWKLRSGRVARVLIRSQHDAPGSSAPSLGWRRRLVWGVFATSAVVAIGTIWLQSSALEALAGRDAERARSRFDWLARVGRESAEHRARLGSLFARAGDPEAARAQFERSLALRPNASAWRGIAWLRAGEKDWAGALEAVEAQREVGELDAATAGLAARIHYDRGDFESARALMDALVSRTPDSAKGYARLARFAFERGDPGQAAAYYREAIEIDPGHHSSVNSLAWILATSESILDPGEALRLAEDAVEADRGDANYLDTLAAAQATAGRFEEAAQAASRAVEIARAEGQDALRAEIEERLALYRARRPYRVPSRAPQVRAEGVRLLDPVRDPG